MTIRMGSNFDGGGLLGECNTTPVRGIGNSTEGGVKKQKYETGKKQIYKLRVSTL